MKKILFFETKQFTGATRVTRTLAKAASKKYVVAFARVGDNVVEDLEYAIEKELPNILFSSFIHINPDVIKAGIDRGMHVVIRNDYMLKDVEENVKFKAFEWYPQADRIIVQTEEMLQELLQMMNLDSTRVRILDNPLDEDDILEKSNVPNPFPNNGNFHFLWVGREDPIKDISTLKEAFKIVHGCYLRTDLTLISNDPNPYRWMKYANCLVISSISEASPNVLKEALFLGTKVVSTDCSPIIRKLLPPEMISPIRDIKGLASVMINALGCSNTKK